MTFDPKRPVRQKNGLKAVFIGNSQGQDRPLLFDVWTDDGRIYARAYHYNGQWNLGEDDKDGLDLINIPEAEDEWEYLPEYITPSGEEWEANPESPRLLTHYWRRRKVAAPETKEPSAELKGFICISNNGNSFDGLYDNPEVIAKLYKREPHKIIDLSKIPASAIVRPEPEKVTRRVWVGADKAGNFATFNQRPHGAFLQHLKSLKEVELTDGEGLS